MKTLKCFFCSRPAPSEPCHIRKKTDGGIALKPSDYYCLPACRKCHSELHQKGEVSFYNNRNYSVEELKLTAVKMYENYINYGEFSHER